MAYSLKQAGSTTGTNQASLTINLTGVGAGNSLIFTVESGTTSTSISSIQDGASNSATLLDSLNANSVITQSAVLPNAAGGSMALKVTFSNSTGGFCRFWCEEWSGMSTSPTDGHHMAAPADGTLNTDLSSGSYTTTVNGDMLYGALIQAQGHAPNALGTGFSAGSSNLGSQGLWTEFATQATAGAGTISDFKSAASSFNNLVWGMGLKAASAATPPPHPSRNVWFG